MLFLKIFDQCEDGWEDDAHDQGRPYRSAIPEDCRWRKWAADKDGKPRIAATEIIARWDEAGGLNNEANALAEQAKALRASIRGEKDAAERKPVEDQLAELTANLDSLRQQASEAQAVAPHGSAVPGAMGR
jgi:type I restriction enzyme M protein